MSDKIKFKFYDVSKATYEIYEENDGCHVGFEYDPKNHTVCGAILNYFNPGRKLRKGVSYFISNGANSIISRRCALNLSIIIPVLLWEFKQKKITASLEWTDKQALIINFPSEAELSLFMFRWFDIFGET